MRNKKSAFVLLMILCSVWVAVVNAGTAETEVTTDSSFVFSQVEYQNVTAYTGDIILDGTDVMLIKDAKLELNGGLLMRGDSTLILDNAELYPAFGRWQESYELHDNAKIVMKRGSSIGSGIFNFRLYDNSLLDVTNSKVEKSVEGMDTGIRIQSFGSYFRVLSMLIGGVLEMHNSSAQVVGCDGDSQIVNSTIDELTVDQNARIVDSQIKSLTVRGGNGQAPHPLSCYLINSTYGNLNKDAFDKGTLYVGWHLNVTVEDAGQIVKGAKVEVYYVTNGSLAQQKVTSSDGKAQFDLVEWKLTELGNQYVGDYRIKASYGTTETQTITLTSSQELVISESSTTWIILPVILVAALVIIVCVKRLPKNSTHAY